MFQVENEETLPVQTQPIFPNYDEFEDESAIGVSNNLAAYSVSQTGKEDELPQYDFSLGLAVGKLPDGYTMASLWEVIPNIKTE